MDQWILGVLILVAVLHVIVLLVCVRIMTQNEIIVRAIPLGSPRVVERSRPPVPQHRSE